ncbi:transcription termination/antitermination factor NusG [Puniceicoccus vermicola]|uniref:Transcription termination/antitermination protein NusG n=2 Tax=Puniceicoccus vermicola TaxID=388746 RepID=A0A7X1E3B8_9BACT|nr:transcription termination/antitermination factor NusG [Puniceicoccus vermicola]
MVSNSTMSGHRWFAVQTLSNQEQKAKSYLDKFVEIEEMGDRVLEVLMPTETVTEVKSGKKSQRTRKFYPGYIFVQMRLYDDDGNLDQEAWYFVKDAQGVINFVGGERPVPLKKEEIDRILKQVTDAEGKERPKVEYEIGEEVKINDGPFSNLTGRIDEVDPDRGRLKVSVSIFGRFTPVDLEYWQVERVEE